MRCFMRASEKPQSSQSRLSEFTREVIIVVPGLSTAYAGKVANGARLAGKMLTSAIPRKRKNFAYFSTASAFFCSETG